MKHRSILLTLVAVAIAGCSGHSGSSLVPTAGAPLGGSSALGPQSALAASAPTGWTATATRAFTVKAPDLGATAASTPITVRLGLQMRNADALKSAVAHGGTVPDSAFLATYAPTAAQ
ncbi:MAG: hypothetical protein JO165_08070, partial [Candidatus Eremiobacteraeota bacterium]|nr:hypothetical protein [Candidatus Eremiobacteraeota bacterium]